MVFFYLPIDTINGILIRNYNVSISAVYKFILMILILIYLLKKKIFVPHIFLIFFILIICFHLLLNIYNFIDVIWTLKFLLIVSSFYFFKYLIKKNRFNIIKNLFIFNFIVLAFNLFLGIMGFGYAQYGRNNIGTRGFFYAGNEVGALLIILAIFLLSYALINKKIRQYIFLSILILILGVFLSSKVAVLGSAIIIFILPIINFIHTKRDSIVNRTSFKVLNIVFFIFIFLFPFAIYLVLYKMNLILRLSYWMNKVDYITLFYSGRNLLAEAIYNFLLKHSTFINTIFGYGYNKILSITGRSVEINLVDFYMLFGILGVVLIYGFIIFQFIKNFNKNSKIFIFKPYVQFSIIFLIILSLTSGHIFNSGLAGIMMGALMSLAYYKKGIVAK